MSSFRPVQARTRGTMIVHVQVVVVAWQAKDLISWSWIEKLEKFLKFCDEGTVIVTLPPFLGKDFNDRVLGLTDGKAWKSLNEDPELIVLTQGKDETYRRLGCTDDVLLSNDDVLSRLKTLSIATSHFHIMELPVESENHRRTCPIPENLFREMQHSPTGELITIGIQFLAVMLPLVPLLGLLSLYLWARWQSHFGVCMLEGDAFNVRKFWLIFLIVIAGFMCVSCLMHNLMYTGFATRHLRIYNGQKSKKKCFDLNTFESAIKKVKLRFFSPVHAIVCTLTSNYRFCFQSQLISFKTFAHSSSSSFFSLASVSLSVAHVSCSLGHARTNQRLHDTCTVGIKMSADTRHGWLRTQQASSECSTTSSQ